jgi:LysM repeat protein
MVAPTTGSRLLFGLVLGVALLPASAGGTPMRAAAGHPDADATEEPPAPSEPEPPRPSKPKRKKKAVRPAAPVPEPAEPIVEPAAPRKTRAPTHADCDHRVPLWEHEVQRGESLGLIAGRYGVRRRDLAALNPALANPDLIHPGDKIRVCPEIPPRLRTRLEIEVAAGDTALAIAARHGLTVDELVSFQEGKLADPNRLRVGSKLVVWQDGGIIPEFQPPTEEEEERRERSKSGGRPRVSVQLPEHKSYVVKRPHLAFGTHETIDAITRALADYRRRSIGGPKVHVGDISKRGGGALRPHLSHRLGRDVDVGYVLRGAEAHRIRFLSATRENFDVARSWALVDAFLDTDRVAYIFMDYWVQQQLYEYAKSHGVRRDELDELFQYPRGRGRSHGVIRHWRGHRDHFHVRFR